MGISIERSVDDAFDLLHELVKNALSAVYAAEVARQRAAEALRDTHDDLVATSPAEQAGYLLMVERRLEALAAALDGEEEPFAGVVRQAREIEALMGLASQGARTGLAA